MVMVLQRPKMFYLLQMVDGTLDFFFRIFCYYKIITRIVTDC